MVCPKDNTQLQQLPRENLIIDYCPQCHGVWLDRGELDKIIKITAAQYGTQETVEQGIKNKEIGVQSADSIKKPAAPKGHNYLTALFDINAPEITENDSFPK